MTFGSGDIVVISGLSVVNDQNAETQDVAVRTRKGGSLIDSGTDTKALVHGTAVGANEAESPMLPACYSLSQNYPNPFNPITEIKYALPKDSRVKLTIYNILGEEVATLLDEKQRAGYKTLQWDSRNVGGGEIASGLYFYRISAGDFVETRKMILLK